MAVVRSEVAAVVGLAVSARLRLRTDNHHDPTAARRKQNGNHKSHPPTKQATRTFRHSHGWSTRRPQIRSTLCRTGTQVAVVVVEVMEEASSQKVRNFRHYQAKSIQTSSPDVLHLASQAYQIRCRTVGRGG